MFTEAPGSVTLISENLTSGSRKGFNNLTYPYPDISNIKKRGMSVLCSRFRISMNKNKDDNDKVAKINRVVNLCQVLS